MALNPALILSGAQPDILGAMSRGNELAAQTNTLRDQNALRQVYQTQGADLLAGKPQAINALAMIDPMTAANIRNTNLEGTYTAERTRILGEEEKRKIAEMAAQMDEKQRQQAWEAAALAIQPFAAAQTPEQWDRLAQEKGRPELIGRFADKNIVVAEFAGGVKEALGLGQGPEQPKPTADMQEYQYAVSQGFNGTFQDYQMGLKRAGATTVTNQLPGQDKFDEAFAKGDADTIKMVSDAGLAARRNIGRINQLDALLSAASTGATAAVQRTLGEWGIPTEGLDVLQSVQAAINSLVPEQRQPGSGPMSDADLALFKESLPRLINQPGGNQIIVQTMRAIAEYDAEGAAIAQRLRAGEISRAEAFDLLQNRENPLASFSVGGANSATGQRATAVPATPPPSAEAVDLLRQNNTPEYRQFFDQVFGEGAAARVLGGN